MTLYEIGLEVTKTVWILIAAVVSVTVLVLLIKAVCTTIFKGRG